MSHRSLRVISKSNMAAVMKEDGVENLFKLQDNEILSGNNLYKGGEIMYKGKESGALSVLNKLRLEGEAGFCDVTLEVEGKQLTAHRCILAANSQFFYSMFSSGMKESNQKVLSLKSIGFASMTLILDYFYTREIVINDENVLDLLNASSFLLFAPVKNACLGYLSKGISTSNCFRVLQIAEQFGADGLAKRANEYIKANFFLVVNKNEEFVSISQKDLVSFISSDDIQVEKEEDIYQSVLKWVRDDEANRVAVLPELLKHLRKDSLPEGFLESEMERERLLMVTRSDGDQAPKETRKAKSGGMKKEKGEKSVQDLRPSTEIHNVMIGVQKYSPRKAYVYDLDKKKNLLLSIVSTDFDDVSPTVLVGRILYMVGGYYHTDTSDLLALSFADFKSAHSPAIMRRPLEFELKATFGEYRTGSSLVNLNGLLYYIGGYLKTLDSGQDTVECYNPETNEWSLCTPINMPRWKFGCVASEQNIYVIGGVTEMNSQSGSLLSSVEKFDPVRKSWSYVAPLQEARSYPGCVYWGEKIYVIGGVGRIGVVKISSCEVYSPLTDEWQTIAQLPYPFDSVYNDIIILENQITVHYNLDEAYNVPCEALQYDLQSDRWVQVKKLGPRDKHGSFNVCSMKLPLMHLKRIASEFCQRDWGRRRAANSYSDSDSDYGW